ncbi:MAG: rRNA (cytidine-2'-O-)-methyltransferase, partial [Sulfuriferula sp.]
YVLVFYEAPHRILDCVADLAETLGGERRITLARELTKLFESIHRLPLGEAQAWLEADPNRQKGEFVLIVEGAPDAGMDEDMLRLRDTLTVLLAELPVKQAAQLAARLTGLKKNAAYALALQMKEENNP